MPSWLRKKWRDKGEVSIWQARGGGKVKIQLAPAEEHRVRAETLSCYTGDTPREEQEAETCETEVRSDGMNMEEEEGEAGQAKSDSGVSVRGQNGKGDYLCASEKKRQCGGQQDGQDRRRVGVENSKVWFNLFGSRHKATHSGRGRSQRPSQHGSNGPSESSALD